MAAKRSVGTVRKTRAQRAARAPQSNAHEQKIIDVLRQFRIVLRSVKQHFSWIEAQCGVSGAQLWALGKIADSPGINVSELARALAIHQSTASNLLDRIESLGLARRERIASDQRVVRLYLTDQGHGVLSKAPQPFRGVLPDALASVPDSTLTALHRQLKTLIDTMKMKDELLHKLPLSGS